MITFVDTGGWFANVVPNDINHAEASRWFISNSSQLLTTNYVVDETLTLLRAKGQPTLALRLGDLFFSNSLAEVYHLTEEDERAAWKVFRTYSDKEWSFTDCTSKVVVETLGIPAALAFDQHFRQFGTVTVVP